MTEEFLKQVGLSPSQAKAYLALITSGSLAPPQLAQKTGESRTNAYMVLDKLVELGLANKDESAKKVVYRPSNPVALERLAEKRRDKALQIDNQVKAALPEMLNYFYTYQSQPGVRFFQGKEGLTKIYEDHLRTRQEVFFVRTPSDEQYFGEVLYKYMQQRAKLGIKAHGLAPSGAGYIKWAKQHDAELKRDMTWFKPDQYTAPVEVSIYGDKVSLISFGEEAMGTIVESPQIAQAMRELWAMAKIGVSHGRPKS